MQTSKRFSCPICQRITKDAPVQVCEYDAGDLLRMNQVMMLIRLKYPALMGTSGAAILLRFWAKYVAQDAAAMAKVKALAARWRGEGLEKTDILTPDPEGLF
jgi:hypothetical protein